MMSASALLVLFLSSVSALTVPVAALDRRAILGRFASAATAVVALPALAITPPGTPSFYACFPSTYTSHCLIEGTSHCTLFKFDRHRGLFKFYARLPPHICRRVQRPAAPWLQAQHQARREPGKRPSRCISSCFLSLPTHTAFSVFGLAQLPPFSCFAPTIHKSHCLLAFIFWTSRRSSAVRRRTALLGRLRERSRALR